jgi:hypothetical protein
VGEASLVDLVRDRLEAPGGEFGERGGEGGGLGPAHRGQVVAASVIAVRLAWLEYAQAGAYATGGSTWVCSLIVAEAGSLREVWDGNRVNAAFTNTYAAKRRNLRQKVEK